MTADKNNIVIISGPSGAGEDSIIEGLSQRVPIERIVTTTSRKLRRGEKEGSSYYFVSKEEFEEGIASNKFFEWAKQYNDQYYGVTFAEIERVRDSDKIGIWKIDFKGVAQAKTLIPGIVTILITAPFDILEQRIRGREGISDEYVAQRMAYTKEWMKHTDLYDYTVANEQGKLGEAIEKVRAIIENVADVDDTQQAT